MAGLPGGPRLRDSAEGVCERLVVGKYGKPPPFQHMAEVPDPQRTGQQLTIEGRVLGLSRLQLLGEKSKGLPVDGVGKYILRPQGSRYSPYKTEDLERTTLGPPQARGERGRK